MVQHPSTFRLQAAPLRSELTHSQKALVWLSVMLHALQVFREHVGRQRAICRSQTARWHGVCADLFWPLHQPHCPLPRPADRPTCVTHVVLHPAVALTAFDVSKWPVAPTWRKRNSYLLRISILVHRLSLTGGKSLNRGKRGPASAMTAVLACDIGRTSPCLVILRVA